MSLDLGELRARVGVDASDVPGGLAKVKSRFDTWSRGMSSSGRRAGTGFGGGLTSGMQSTIGRAHGWLGQQGDRLGSSLGGRMVKSAGGQVGKIAGVVGKVGAMAGVAVAGAAAAGVAGLAVLGGAGLAMGTKVAAGNEQAEISFTTMLGSAERAGVFLKDLQQFAAETPFEFPELQTAASSLISAGVEADKVIPIMRTLGDVTSGMGTGSEGVKRATVALQQMQAAGRITGEDLNQLRDAGIPVYDLLANATGKSKEEVVKLAQAGKLGKKELGQMMSALESGKGLERFSGLMEKQSTSIVGLWSTLKDTVGQGLAGIAQNFFPLMKQGLGTISSIAAGVFGWFKENGDQISNIFESLSGVFGTFGKIIARVFGVFIKSTGDGADTLERISNWVNEHEAQILAMFLGVTAALLGAADAGATVASVILRGFASVIEVVGNMRGVMYDVFAAIIGYAAKAFGWIPGIGEKLAVAQRGMELLGDSSRNMGAAAAKAARGAADGIDKTLRPGIKKAREELNKLSKTELASAALRDSAAKAGRLIGDIGDKANGSRIKLRKWSDVSKLAANEQKALRDRLDQARRAMGDHIEKMQKGGAGQAELTKAWKRGKAALYDEFKQMGLSDKAAKKLADRYAGIKPKVETKITAPGLSTASSQTKTYVERQDNIDKSKTTSVSVKWGSSGKVALKRSGGMTYIANASGGVLPGFTPGRDPYHFVSTNPGVPDLKLSGGEAILRPEATQALGKPWVDRVNRAARSGGASAVRQAVAFADGGTVPTFAKAANATKPAHSAGSQLALEAARSLQAAAQAALAKAAAAAAAKAGGAGPNTLGGAVGAGRAGAAKAARRLGASPVSYHSDPSGYPSFDAMIGIAGGKRIVGHFLANRGKYGIRYIIHNMRIWSGRNWGGRRYSPISGSGDFRHVRHVHASFANGGIFGRARGYATGTPFAGTGFNWTGEKGAELVVNPQLRRYSGGERVLDRRQTERVLSGSSRSGSLVGSLTLQTSDRARDAIGELTHALRVIDQGGPYAAV